MGILSRIIVKYACACIGYGRSFLSNPSGLDKRPCPHILVTMEATRVSPHRFDHLLILGLCVCCIAAASVLSSSPDGRLWLPIPFIRAEVPLPDVCWSRRFLGVSCPGCGLTRSFVAMAHGSFRQALDFNLMGPFLYLLCWAQVPYRVIEIAGVLRSSTVWGHVNQYANAVTWAMGAGFIAAWLWRFI
jgi:hypothetical protein